MFRCYTFLITSRAHISSGSVMNVMLQYFAHRDVFLLC